MDPFRAQGLQISEVFDNSSNFPKLKCSRQGALEIQHQFLVPKAATALHFAGVNTGNCEGSYDRSSEKGDSSAFRGK